MSVATGKTRRKAFKVAAVSSNMNSFGLTGMILIGRDGEAWEVAANSIYLRQRGSVLQVSGRNFATLGFELPTRLPSAPRKVIAEVWQNRKEQHGRPN